MVNLRRLGVLMVFSFIVIKGGAQAFNPKQLKLFKTVKDTIVLDSLSLVPGSVYMKTFPQGDSSLLPVVNYKVHALIFKGKKPDSILVAYKRFPYNFENVFYHKNASDLYADPTRRNNPFTINYNNNKSENLFQNDGLNKNGNISRGISFGNNQDVVVNSNLNLQVSGKLTPEIDMVMAATDNNIPFQADGTTAQLQEFDKVFIQLSNYNTKMIVGDFQLSKPQSSYFMNFYKRAQGLYVENTYRDSSAKKPLVFKTQVSGAVSRGKFSRQVFFGTENNQGPYRLNGANNEPFIIILSGTEKIYIDGKLLQRGQENDYTIDYNTGQITFTARQQITKDKRIVAEFQYAERNYARSLFFFSEEVLTGKSKIFFNLYSEQDNKNRPLQQTLSQDEKDVMIDAGNDQSKAVYSGATLDTSFSSTSIYYRKTDTVVGGFVYPGVYVYSPNPANPKYTLKMSFVGVGKGNYNELSTAANGKVFQWIAPVKDSLQGSYEPVIPLVTPKQNQMLTAGITHSITENNTISVEGVYTKYDANKFSTKDKGDDEAGGVKVISKNQTILRIDSSRHQTKLIYNLNYEYVQKQFTQIERFRSIEFDRDWNRPLTSVLLNDQHIASAELGLLKSNRAGVTYTFNLFDEGNDYKGIRHNVTADYKEKTFTGNYTASYLTTHDNLNFQTSEFFRHKTLVSKRIEKLKFAYTDVFENNLFHNSTDNILLPRAYQFWEWEGSISNADSSKNNIKVFYKERRDKRAYNNGNNGLTLKDSTFATNIGLQASVFSIKNNPITVLVTYRKLDLSKNITSNSTLKPDNTLLNRVEYNPRYFKGLVTSSIFYETGYGQQNKLDYTYTEVAPGLGQYAWIDYNGDGIQQKNEFEIALYPDQQKFIRIYTPTNDYVKVLQNQMSISVSVRPSAIFKNNKLIFHRFINRWVLQTALRFDNKISDNNSISNYNPFKHPTDSFLLAANNNSRYSVFFNQSSAVFGADYTHIDNKSRQLLTNGIEEKTIFSDEVKWRFNFLKAWAINSDNTISKKGNISQFFATRNYLIKGYESEQKLLYQPNTVFRLSILYKYTEKRNKVSDATQNAFLNTYGFEIKYNQTEKGSLTGSLNFIRISYNDIENSSVAYEMLNGLSKGDNYTWELNYQRNINKNIQISINYTGRKTPTAPIVHLGGAQIRAYF
jgi:hypothetical protein